MHGNTVLTNSRFSSLYGDDNGIVFKDLHFETYLQKLTFPGPWKMWFIMIFKLTGPTLYCVFNYNVQTFKMNLLCAYMLLLINKFFFFLLFWAVCSSSSVSRHQAWKICVRIDRKNEETLKGRDLEGDSQRKEHGRFWRLWWVQCGWPCCWRWFSCGGLATVTSCGEEALLCLFLSSTSAVVKSGM